MLVSTHGLHELIQRKLNMKPFVILVKFVTFYSIFFSLISAQLIANSLFCHVLGEKLLS